LAEVDFADVREGTSLKTGETYRYLLVRFQLVEQFGVGPLEYPIGVFDRLYFSGKALPRLRNLLIVTTGGLPVGDENGEIPEEEIAAALNGGKTYLLIDHETDDNNIPHPRVGWKFSSDPEKLVGALNKS